MRDVTDILSNYRECVRHLWNTYFLDEAYRETWGVPGPPDEAHFDKLDRFEEIAGILFMELVLEKIGDPSSNPAVLEQRRSLLRVVPGSEFTPIMIDIGSNGSHRWDDSVSKIGPTADLRFVEFFNWDQIGFQELHHYLVKIAAFPEHPELIGREALIECLNCRVVVYEPSAT